METFIKKSETNSLKRTLRFFTLLFSLVVFFAVNTMARGVETNSSKPAASYKEDAALAEAQKDASRQTYFNYILMAVGIVVVLSVAWFTQSGTKKTGNSGFIEKKPAGKFRHSSHEKKYGTNRARG